MTTSILTYYLKAAKKKIHVLFNTALVAIFLVFVNCWFARDVTAAMLVFKDKSISLLWELNSIFM